MIESITLKNFQSHKTSELEFHPGVNAIIGPSDSGKTAIIRAIRWLVWNRPLGDAFRSVWGGDTLVGLSFPEGHVQRIKTNKDNMFILGHHDEFKAAGMDVPEEIRGLLNLDEVNLQQQLDRPFLLDESPGAVAEHFNRIAHLDVIDNAVSSMQKWIRQIEQDIKSAQSQSIEYKNDLETYLYLPEFESAIENLESEERTAQMWKGKVLSLSRIIAEIDSLAKEIADYDTLLTGSDLVESLLELYSQKRETKKQLERLEGLIEQIDSVQQGLGEVEALLSVEKKVTKILSLIKERTHFNKQKEDFVFLLQEIVRVDDSFAQEKQKLERLEKDFKKLMPNVCPLCGGKVKK